MSIEMEKALVKASPVPCGCDDHRNNQDLVKKDSFLVEKSTFSKSYLRNLLTSSNPKDKIMLNLIITKIIKNDHKDSFEYLLDHGYTIDVLNDHNQTAIHLLIYHNADNILNWGQNFLLTKCANNISHTDSNGLSYLHFACMIGKKKAVKKFLEQNSDINTRWYHNFEDNRNGFTPLHFAVINHKTEIVKFLLHYGADVNSTDSLGRTPLHIACCISKKFIKPQKYDVTSHPDWSSEMKVLKLLLTHGADLKFRDKLGNTPLLNIFKIDNYRRELKFDEWFLYDISKNVKNLLKRQKEKFDYFMELGIDITVINNNGENILHRIIGNLKLLRFPVTYDRMSFEDEFHANLINQLLSLGCGININEENNHGETPLLCAISFISLDIVKILLHHNADVSNLKFNYHDKNFFNYPAILPNLKSIQNLFGIIDLLITKGFKMTLQMKVIILQFLMHQMEDCECCYTSNLHNTQINMMHTFCYGNPQHISHVIKGVYEFSAGTELEPLFQTIYYHNVLKYSKLCKLAKIYYPKDYYLNAKRNNCCSMEKFFEEAKNEIARMKHVVLEENMTLYDLLIMDIYDIYDYAEDWEKIDKLLQRFPCYRNIFEGRIALSKSLNYFFDSSCDHLRVLTIPSLPKYCCELINSYLNTQDILNAYLAVADITNARPDDTLDFQSLSL